MTQLHLDRSAIVPPSVLVALLLAFAPACADAPDQTLVEQPMAELHASEDTQAELGVSSWAVYDNGGANGLRIVGRDATLAPQIELRVEQEASDSIDHVALRFVLPEAGFARLSHDGSIGESSSDFAERLAQALYSDLGTNTAPLEISLEDRLKQEGTELGSGRFAFSVADEGHIDMGWSLFGYAADLIVGNWCLQGTRDHYDAYASNNASCWVKRWASDSVFDCRILLHYGISGGRSDTCNWYTYRNP